MAKFLKTESEKIDGQRWVKLLIEDCVTNFDISFLVIESRGANKPFLSQSGWQSSEDSHARLSVKIEKLTDSSLALTLSPEIIQHLSLANYTCHLLTRNLSAVDKFVYTWRGIPPTLRPNSPLEEVGTGPDTNIVPNGPGTDPLFKGMSSPSSGPWVGPENHSPVGSAESETKLPPKESTEKVSFADAEKSVDYSKPVLCPKGHKNQLNRPVCNVCGASLIPVGPTSPVIEN